VTTESATALAHQLTAGSVAALARAITLAESSRADHAAITRELLTEVLPATGRSQRIGITGAPGVGKSTLIDTLGVLLTGLGLRIAVLAIDPSSVRTGGAILGDQARMSGLNADPQVFLRGSASGRTTGGIGPGTRESILLCEAAGFDVVIVESVGVGQSETAIADVVDVVIALIQPGAGDDLQGMKRGLLELAEIVVVTKADGADVDRARRTAGDYRRGMRLFAPRSPQWVPRVLTCSAHTGEGCADVWAAVVEHQQCLTDAGERSQRRAEQRQAWFTAAVADGLRARFHADPDRAALLSQLSDGVRAGQLLPTVAALRALTSA